jgi:hypothetical protein
VRISSRNGTPLRPFENHSPVATAFEPLVPACLALLNCIGPGESQKSLTRRARKGTTSNAWRENKALGNVRSWIAVPLVVYDKVLGLLSISKTEPRAFPPSISARQNLSPSRLQWLSTIRGYTSGHKFVQRNAKHF